MNRIYVYNEIDAIELLKILVKQNYFVMIQSDYSNNFIIYYSTYGIEYIKDLVEEDREHNCMTVENK